MRLATLLIAFSLYACATSAPPDAQHPVAQASPEAPAPRSTTEPRAPMPPAVVDIPNARNPLPSIVTGGIPTEENLHQARQLGYRTIISLLPDAESVAEAALVQQHGMTFVSIPIAGPDDLTEANARKLGEVLARDNVRPLILHCASGNRAGALLALQAFYVDHVSIDEALALGDAAGLTKLRPVVEERLRAASASTTP